MTLLNSCNHVHVQPGRSPSKRGVGIQFGPNITEAFLNTNGLGECIDVSVCVHNIILSLAFSLSLSLSLSRFANSKSWSEARWLWSCSQRQMHDCLLSSQLLVRQWCNDDITCRVTIWSHPFAPSDQMGNKGAYITFSRDLQPEFTTYEAVVRHDCYFFTVSMWIFLSLSLSHTYTQPHPNVKPMQYASSLFGLLS